MISRCLQSVARSLKPLAAAQLAKRTGASLAIQHQTDFWEPLSYAPTQQAPRREPAMAPELVAANYVPYSAGAETPIFFIHDLTGMIGHLLPIAQQMETPVCLFEQCTTTPNQGGLQSTLEYYADAIDAAQPEGHLHLGGYSRGAQFAYEAALILQQRGRTIRSIVSVDGGAFDRYVLLEDDALVKAKARVVMGFLFNPDTPQFKAFLPRVLDPKFDLAELTEQALQFPPEQYAPHLHRKIARNPRNDDFRAFVRSLLQGMRSYSHQRQRWAFERHPDDMLSADVLLLRATEPYNLAYQNAMRDRIGVDPQDYEKYPQCYHWSHVSRGRMEMRKIEADHLLVCTTHFRELAAEIDAFHRRLNAADDIANWLADADCGAY